MRIFVCLILSFAFSVIPVWAKPDIEQERMVSKAQVEGFRSAHFGITADEVVQAIQKDFDIPESAVQKELHPTEKTGSLWVSVNNLLPGSGPSKIYYIFGFKSKRLIQVNVIWGRQVTEKPDPDKVIATANQLRDHFIRKDFQKEGLMANAPLGEGVILVFRGKDSKGRMVVLLLSNIPSEQTPTNETVSLRLSYISNPESPDVFRLKKGNF